MRPYKKVVITGGPCAGKSTALAKIVDRFQGLGYKVYVVPEMATLMILGGMKPWEMSSEAHYAFESTMVKNQLAFEASFEEQAKFQNKPVLIVCDRGIMDNAGFVDPVLWGAILEENGLNTSSARDKRYDAVIHMVTAAKGAEKFYTLENNAARSETPEQARVADDKIIDAWTGHHHMRIIGNQTNFDEKVNRVINEISNVVGVPEHIEQERKFLVKVVGKLPKNAQTFDIVQHYLPVAINTNETVRVRRRGQNNEWVFTRTSKKPRMDGGLGCIETEKMLTPGEYWRTLQEVGPVPLIEKKRTVFVYNDMYFELDYFPSKDFYMLEIETEDIGKIKLPKCLELIREVTDEPAYRNVNLAVG